MRTLLDRLKLGLPNNRHSVWEPFLRVPLGFRRSLTHRRSAVPVISRASSWQPKPHPQLLKKSRFLGWQRRRWNTGLSFLTSSLIHASINALRKDTRSLS